jgi:hypothetical protein
MSNTLKYVAYALGGTTLVAGSFFLATALSGTPLNAMKGVGGLFPPEPSAVVTTPAGPREIEEQLEGDTRSDEQIFDAARAPLTAFMLDDPFSAQELSTIEHRLRLKLEELDRRGRSLDEREAHLDRDAEYLGRQFKELDRLKAAILTESDEARAVGDEIEANRKALAAREVQVYKSMAPQFEEGEAEMGAAKLVDVYDAEEAAKILRHLPDDRVTELMTAILVAFPDKHRDYMRAYQLAKTP